MAACEHRSNIPNETLAALPDSQGGSGRHRCVVCAYAQGIAASSRVQRIDLLGPIEQCRHGRRAPTNILTALPESQAGLGRHKCATCAFQFGFNAGGINNIEEKAKADVETEKATHGSEEGGVEGNEVFRLSRTFERNPRNRRLAIQAHGTKCFGCEFDFDKFYGPEFARSYIEIHHRNPLASRGIGVTDPVKDLCPLCSNCHSMVHRDPKKVLSIEDLRKLIAKAKETAKP